MTFVYCDAGLANEQGHFASLCRATTAYLRQRGDHVLVLDRPVRLFPAPIAAVRPVRDRAQAVVPTIAFLGRLGSSAGS
jgi:hypothetical protein